MAKRRRTRRRATPAPEESRRRFQRHPAVWLATLSTVVGLATGMFTLRDQVFPREAGTAVATSMPVYQQQVGQVCDEINDNDEARARDEKAVKRRLGAAKTPVAQRNVLVDAVRRTASRSAHALTSFGALEAPRSLAATRRGTEAAWSRYLARLRDFTLALDRSSTRAQLVAALQRLAADRPALARESDGLRTGLERLGAADCDLEPQIVVRTFTLPRLDAGQSTKKRASARRARGPDPAPADPPANPPAEPPANPPANPPSAPPTDPLGEQSAQPPANPPAPPVEPPTTPSAPPANPPGAGGGGGGD